MLLLLDNFDSFTYNLVDYFEQLDVQVKVIRNDSPLSEITKENYDAVVISPGPESPEKAGVLMDVLDYYHQRLPILGICLGHQAIGQYFGATLSKAERPMHGKSSKLIVKEEMDTLFKNLPLSFDVIRYHSLILQNVNSPLSITATTEKNEVMAISHQLLPIHGLQFHPEAILTEHGLDLLNNWINSWKRK